MDTAARESYGAAAERLDTFAGTAEAPRVAAVADDVLAVADLLGREPRLRRALSDPGRSGTDRIALLRGVLAGKVGEEAIDLIAALVDGRWRAPSALREAVERLGVDTVLAGAEKAGDLGEVEDELFRFGQIVAGDPALAAALADSTVPASRRAELARKLLAGKARPATVRLAELALAGFGGRSFVGSLTRLVELSAERRERTVAYVTSAVPLTEAEGQRLADQLARMYGRSVTLKIELDPGVIGGLSVRIGSDLYDGTVARRLAEARNALTK
jgi:F-type H+-transporting ATPase subunit delta